MQYQIAGEPLPVVTCQLAAGETMITERGSMSWMTPNMRMETTTNGGLGKAFGRLLAGEALFQNRYTAQGGPGLIAFASSRGGSRGIYLTTRHGGDAKKVPTGGGAASFPRWGMPDGK